jgi:hypothetical protein
MTNLITLKIITCHHCDDYGEIIDRFDQAKRARCHCQPVPRTHWPCPCLAERVQSDNEDDEAELVAGQIGPMEDSKLWPN